jgi:hypothetical protein
MIENFESVNLKVLMMTILKALTYEIVYFKRIIDRIS